MSSISMEGNRVVFQSEQKKKILLDLSDLMANKSRLPMQATADELTIPKLISELKEGHEVLSEGTGEGLFPAFLQDILMASYISRTSAPLNVVEIGAVSGVLSYHLATLLGRMNKESHLCCVSNVIGNESANHWLDRISLVEQPPKLSMLVSDYEDTQLQADSFDIVLLNGEVYFDKPYETLREAERLMKKGGILLCHAKEAPLLESSFKLIFSQWQEYEIVPQETILVAAYSGYSWGQEKMPDLEEAVSELFQILHQTLKTASRIDEIRPCVCRIDQCIDKAIKIYDSKRKVELIRLKELVLDYMLNIDSEFAVLYKERCFAAIAGQIEEGRRK